MVKRVAALAVLLLVGLSPAAAQAPGTVSVLYAGSLVTQMEGPVKQALRAQGIDFQGEPGGSKALANFIAAGTKSPDVFISVKPALVTGLGTKVSSATTFASTSLGIGWSDKSRYAALFAKVAAGKTAMIDALSTRGLQIGRTDPSLDPKGAYTIEGMKMLAGDGREHAILGDDENAAQVFPEENLLTRVELGQADVGFFYRTEAVARGLHFMALPGKASLSDKITYTLAVMKDAPHPAQAKAFAAFILTGQGKSILQKAGIEYLAAPKVLIAEARDTECGYVTFTPDPGSEVLPTGEFKERITAEIHGPGGVVLRERLDYAWVYRNDAADPWSPKNHYGNNTIPVLFQFPAADKLSSESPFVQYIAAHTTPRGYTTLKDCPA